MTAPAATNRSPHDVLLDYFLRIYTHRCEEAKMPICPRATRAAALMLRCPKNTTAFPPHLPPLPPLPPLSSPSPAVAVAAAAAAAASIPPASLSYTLHAVPIGTDGSGALFPSLACLPLAALDLTDCFLSDAGARLLADALAHSPHGAHIRRLVLSAVGATDGAPLALIITAAAQLEEFDVSCNKLGAHSAGFAVLCGAMRCHAALREVSLRDNALCGTCALTMTAIAEWIVCAGHVDVLRSVDLRHNALGFSSASVAVAAETVQRGALYGSHPFVDALLFNNTLEAMELAGNALPADVLHVVGARLAVNRRTRETMRRLYSNGRDEPTQIKVEKKREE